MRVESNSAAPETEPEELQPYEQPLAAFLTDAFRHDTPQTGQHPMPTFLHHKYRANDGTIVDVKRYGWSITPVGRTAVRFDARPDAPAGSGVRVGYRITVGKPQTFETNSQDVSSPVDAVQAQHEYDAALRGDRAFIFEHPKPGTQQEPVPVDPATAEHLTTLLYTSTPL